MKIKKLLSAFSVSFFTVFSAFSAQLTFPVTGLMTVSPEPEPVVAEWNDNWFLENSAFKYHHGIARVACMLSEISYTDVSENPYANALKVTYQRLGVENSDMDFHYNLDYTAPVLGDNQAAFSIASKKISGPSGSKTLVFIVIRGTPLNANEWISNLSISDTSRKGEIMHEGFYKTMVQVHTEMLYYMLRHKIEAKDACFLITGHSRGAAIANLLGATMAEKGNFNNEKVFVYTFASPNVTQAENVSSPLYDFIWNIVNGEDIVPTVPPCRNNWKYQKYGHILTIVNRWNVDPKTYDEEYVPKVNQLYTRLLEREYCPFKNGTFIQSSVARVLTNVFSDVGKYYNGAFHLRQKAENLLHKVFPETTDLIAEKTEEFVEKQEEKEKKGFLFSIQQSINESTNGGVDYVMNAFVDMHACEMYLSWMTALEEDKLFSNLGNIQLVINGYYECAVFDLEGNPLAQILDGIVKYKNIKIPIAAMPLPLGTAIGFPATENFNLVIYKNSLIPSKISVQIEHYDVKGNLIYTDARQNFYPHSGMALTFKAGEVLVECDRVEPQKINGKEMRTLVKAGNLNQQKIFRIQPEIYFNTEQQFGSGIHAGSSAIYGSLLTTQPVKNIGRSIEISPGIGHQTCLWKNLQLDTEAYAKFIYIFEDIENNGLNIVPSFRTSLSMRPFHRFQLFGAVVFDAKIDGANEGAFDSKIRKHHMGKINITSDVHLMPSIQFGIKF